MAFNYFGNLALGVISLLGSAGYPTASSYTSITLYGNTIVDNVWVQSVPLTDVEIIALAPYVSPVWGGTTILLANFDNNSVNAGNITNITNPITNFDIYRKKSTDTSFDLLATIPVSQSSYIDITAQPNITYTYEAVAKNATEISEPIQNTITTDFFNVYLIDKDTKDVYIFNLNIEFDGTSNETAHQRYDGYNKYSAHTFGDRDFRTGSVSAILSEDCSLDSGIIQGVDYIQKFQTFINNGKVKLFKDRKGNVFNVVTTGGVKQAPLQVSLATQPYIISFNFEEVGGDLT